MFFGRSTRKSDLTTLQFNIYSMVKVSWINKYCETMINLPCKVNKKLN